MADFSGHLHRDRDLHLEGRAYEVWLRRALLGLLLAFVAAAALNAFGQRPVTTTATASPVASLSVDAPQGLRGGLVFQAKFEIEAKQAMAHPALELSPGWTEGISLNTLEPAPATEISRDGILRLGFDPIAAGETLTFWTQWQVNPVNVGKRSQDVSLFDGDTRIATTERDVTVFP